MKKSAIYAAFADLTLKDLNRLRRMSDYPIKSNLRKADLVEALEDNFRKNPVQLLFQLPIFDLEMLAELCHGDRNSVLCAQTFPDQLYIQEFNLCEWDYTDDGNVQQMWLTDDMYFLISPFIDQIVDDIRHSERLVIDLIFWGMIWLYGFLPAQDYIKVLKKNFGSRDEQWWPMYERLVRYFPFIDYYNEDGFIVHPTIGEYDYMLEERRSRGFDLKPLKEYPLEEIIQTGAGGPYFRFGTKAKEYKDAEKALMKCGFDESESAARLSRLWIAVQELDGHMRPSELFHKIVGDPDLKSAQEFEDVATAIFTYMNNIPRWCLGGRFPTDIKRTPAEENQLRSALAAMDKVADTFAKTPRVGRNDPCPCGSGLKYKNCHGKNVS